MAVGRWRGVGRVAGRTVALVSGTLLALAVVCVVVQLVWVASGDRSAVQGERLAEGVVYDRIVWSEPRPVVIHVATIDLNVEGVEIEIGADYIDDTRVAARTTSDYVRESDAIVGVNASFFYPFEENPPWSPYPGDGDPVTPLGFVVSDGVARGSAWQEATFSLVGDGGAVQGAGRGASARAVVGSLAEGAEEAISGASVLVSDGEPAVFEGPSDRPGGASAYARTVVAANNDQGLVYLIVVDGKQPGYSEGLTLTELAMFLVDFGVTDAVELDGGGSSTMVAGHDAAGGFRRLSRPINSRLPGRERTVATHIGVRSG